MMLFWGSNFSNRTQLNLQPRWEKFAPGPIRAVTVAQSGDPSVPKRKGRPPKRKGQNGDDGNHAEPSEVKPLEGEQVFGPRSKKRGVTVPAVEEVMSPVAPRTIDFGSPETTQHQPWPTRSTFAGRKKPDNKEAADVFEARRSKFYGSAPSHVWKEGRERSFWTKRVELDNLDSAMEKCLNEQGVQSSSCPAASPKGKGRGRGRGAAKAKAKVKEPGRHRARGRGKGAKH